MQWPGSMLRRQGSSLCISGRRLSSHFRHQKRRVKIQNRMYVSSVQLQTKPTKKKTIEPVFETDFEGEEKGCWSFWDCWSVEQWLSDLVVQTSEEKVKIQDRIYVIKMQQKTKNNWTRLWKLLWGHYWIVDRAAIEWQRKKARKLSCGERKH